MGGGRRVRERGREEEGARESRNEEGDEERRAEG